MQVTLVDTQSQLKLDKVSSLAKDTMIQSLENLVMKLIIEQNLQIKQMEEQMEKLVKEKEEVVNKAQTPMDIVPLAVVLVTKIPTLATTLTTGVAEGVEYLAEAV